jgi:DNA-3-methyladenine glycosylase I
MEIVRCPWARKEIEIEYHDHQWGIPLYDDRKLFEMLILEGMQAGLSWITILNKREHMRKAFDGFDPVVISGYTQEKREELLQDAGIIRNRLKINALIENAKAFLRVTEEFHSFKEYIWSFVEGTPIINHWQTVEEVPIHTEISDRMSKDLKKRGFKFVGTTICYSYMQAVGMVNDHLLSCICRS